MPGDRTSSPPPGHILKRLAEGTDRSAGPDGCWPWTGPGRHLAWGEEKDTISRLMWFATHGEWPPAHPGIRRTCKTKWCLNPKHLVATKEQRFWARVDKGGPILVGDLGACWIWTGTLTTNNGYGEIRDGAGRPPIRAHRYSWEMNVGPIPPGLQALHKCDNKRCVRPTHLYLGTDVENTRDRVERGGVARGEKLSRAIREARERRAAS